jgi:hypothetical protein
MSTFRVPVEEDSSSKMNAKSSTASNQQSFAGKNTFGGGNAEKIGPNDPMINRTSGRWMNGMRPTTKGTAAILGATALAYIALKAWTNKHHAQQM